MLGLVNLDSQNKHLLEKHQHPSSQSIPMTIDNNDKGGGGDHRHVHFAPMAEVYELDENYGDDQISNTLWYSQNDYGHFELNRRNDIRAMQRAQECGIERLDSSVHCMRGLVPLMTHRDRIIRRRVRATHVVLVEQERQEEEGIVDPYRIAFASYQVTFLSCIEAEARGKQYSEEIAFLDESTSFESPHAAKKEKWMEKDGLHQTMLPPATPPSHQPSLLTAWQRLLSQISTAILTSQS